MKASAKLWLATCIAFGLWAETAAQVRSVTLGIRTHCPYGIRGCWAEIRDGLERPNAIASISKEPDTRTDTCEVQMRADWAPDAEMFARNFRSMHIGVDIRGVEAIIDGVVERKGTNLVLRLGNSPSSLVLAPLIGKVQWDTKRQRPQTPARSERNAFQKLSQSIQKHEARFRVVGPLTSVAREGEVGGTLHVRRFERLDESSQLGVKR